MEYYTKYLPFRGNLENGSKFIDKSGAIQIFERAEYLNPSKGVLWMDQNMWPHYASECIGPVKLFLCSNEIKIGDILKCKTASGKWTDVEVGGEPNKFMNDPDYFKVIGEISSEAIWIAEGMKLTEDEVKIRDLNNEHGSASSVQRVVVFVKCPTCGRFQ